MREGIRLRAPVPSPIRVTTEVRGLVSGTSALSDAEQREEAQIKSVALAQPHRRGSDDKLDESALGRFVKRWHRDAGDRLDRFHAGCMYAEDVDRERVSRGFMPRQGGDSPWGSLTTDELQKRKEEAIARVRDANGAFSDLHPQAVPTIYAMCYDDKEIPVNRECVADHALYRLCLHYGIIKRGYHG